MQWGLWRHAAPAALAWLGLSAATSFAGTFSWGDLSDPAGDVMYLGVTEVNTLATTLFAPEPGVGGPTVVGNALRFDPQNFSSQSSGGGSDSTSSTVEMTVMANAGQVLRNLLFSEVGDYTLSGLPGGAASTSVGATFTWQVLEVNNAPVALPVQTDFLQVTTGAGANGGDYVRPTDDGTALAWEGSVLLDIEGFLAGQSVIGAATKVKVTFENVLETQSDSVSSAFIKKKEIGGLAISANVPEPASAAIGLLLAAAMPFRWR